MFYPKPIILTLLASAASICLTSAAPPPPPPAVPAKLDPAEYISVPINRCDTPNRKCHKLNTAIVTEGSTNVTAAGFVTIPGYLFDLNSWKYYLLHLKIRMLSVDVNLGGVKCGRNAAFYTSQMKKEATLGTGYCDAHTDATGTCNEMDILEGNAATKAYSAHPYADTENGYCSHQGCNVNTNRDQNKFVGPGLYIDTTKTFTLVSAFTTHDKSDKGDLVGVQQWMLQDGKALAQTLITDDYCLNIETWNLNYTKSGGLEELGRSFDIGHVLVFSFWGDQNSIEYGNNMSWLDQGVANNAKCNQTAGESGPSYSNIRIEFIKDIKVLRLRRSNLPQTADSSHQTAPSLSFDDHIIDGLHHPRHSQEETALVFGGWGGGS
ncbi:hypothetical protein HK097_008016 [Rhizophlyctis rosea]|uniref:cellulose 1,4-beta-cellobiosidase (non-reducing end) n=1 Tax=Rhizophlyctis rosea TaxID=64517 RepID=A0AAD5SDQ0_9FUNG|nr:hypothetical protein HK097_008016 [Rhizophlyctis rosea]